MKVAMVLPEAERFSPSGGGVTRVISEIVHRLGHEVTIFAPFARMEYRSDVMIRHLFTHLITNARFIKPRRFGRYVRSIYPTEAAIKIKLYGHYPVICVHNRPRFVPIIKKLNPRSRIILYMHNDHLIDLDDASFLKTMSDVEIVIANSQYIADGITAKDPGSRAKIRVLHNGVTLEHFEPLECPEFQGSVSPSPENRYQWLDSKNVLFVGRLVPGKGAHVLIEAMKLVVAAIPKATLTIVGGHAFGDARDTPYIKNLRASSLSLQDRVNFTGFVPYDQLSNYYAIADVFVSPSIYPEPFALVNLEAMASGLPVIASKRGGTPEAIGDAGILFEPEGETAVSDLAQNIIHILNNQGIAQQLGRKARARVERHFSWDTKAQEFDDILTEMA